MGRKLFTRHLNEVAASPPPELSDIHSPDEGLTAFTFSYATSGQPPRSCGLKLLATDVDEYPDGNTYMLFTDDETADRSITGTLEIITAVLMGKPLTDALAEISQSLQAAVTSGQVDNPIELDSSDPADEHKDDDDSSDDGFVEYDSDDESFGLAVPEVRRPSSTREPGLASRIRSRTSLNMSVNIHKIKSDLRAAKDAGFRVGVHGDLTTGGIVCISIRVTKLGISEEAMQAWGLRRSHYFVLMIRFLHGYRDLTQVREDTALSGLTEMRAVLCEHYKPSREEALAAFGQVSTTTSGLVSSNSPPIESLFIASPLNDLLRDRFPKIVKFRESCGFNWPSAEAFVNEVQGKAVSAVDNLSVDDYYIPDDTEGKALPDVVKADTVEGKILKNVSLPLAAMQFTLRHFVRCTEFCLVCHCKVENTFEALKPYVCSRPLCLYQYMALGFGPSLEWEILSQPSVVDLLVSFCYSAARQGRLKELPVGIDLKVPILPHYKTTLSYARYGYQSSNQTSTFSSANSYDHTFSAKVDFDQKELLFDPEQKSLASSLRNGDWVVIYSKDKGVFHYRIEEAMFPTYRLSDPIKTKPVPNQDYSYDPGASGSSSTRPSTPPKAAPPGMSWVKCYGYDSRFDALTSNEQHHAILVLLDTLPSILDMQQYLQRPTSQDPSLKTWRSSISDPALQLLRWIIASNRSCIMQVDRLDHGKSVSSNRASTSEDRVVGMEQWMQFRFAQGAPDKEQRFVDSVNKESADKSFPTFFAWHGSPIGNWHSIIRQGLRYDETLHGRAYGNGVYMSPQATTSMGYSSADAVGTWPNSTLKISSALSLQEVANVPEKFVSKSPHYVVADIDWIQTRYLFVKSSLNRNTTGDQATSIREYVQEPQMVAKNEVGQSIKIPITAVSKSRRPAVGQKSTKNGNKKSKSTTTIDQATAEQQEDDANSIVSDMEDLALLSSDNDDFDEMSVDDDYFEAADSHNPATVSPATNTRRALDTEETDFRPGSLDVTKIKFLPPPSDAITSATKALMGAFKEAVKTQESTPLHKLGWYINPDTMENVYQWIVELHSFDEKLPLAKDMKKAGLTSIVLEMRFTNQFPFSPPFIRVVQPRFLPFNQGGGGHVTEGGAICMELLTNSGWCAVTSIESVLLQVQLAMSDEERPARLLQGKSYAGGRGDNYGVGEAVAAYERACRAHGWQIPEGFSKFALGEGPLM